MSADPPQADTVTTSAMHELRKTEGRSEDRLLREHTDTGNEPVDTPKSRRSPIPRRLLPQPRPTPTVQEAAAVIGFLRARFRETGHPGDRVTARLLAAEGLLNRYSRAAAYAAQPPHGLEHAWELVAATLAREVVDLAAAWAEHPEFDPRWVR
jgi:hypothetical protein